MNNTLECLKKAMEDALYTYGQCLIRDCEESGMADVLENWAAATSQIIDTLDTIL